MIKKGYISNKSGNYAEAVIPEENNTVTAMLPLAKSISPESVNIGDTCAVAFYDNDTINFADGIIIAIY
jgi:hypothetical protein